MSLLRPLLFCLGCFILSDMDGQSRFIQFIASDIQTHQEALDLSASLNQHDGVVSARAEMKADNVILFLEEGMSFNKLEVEIWPELLGYNLLCFRSGIMGLDKLLQLRPEDCNVLPETLED